MSTDLFCQKRTVILRSYTKLRQHSGCDLKIFIMEEYLCIWGHKTGGGAKWVGARVKMGLSLGLGRSPRGDTPYVQWKPSSAR